MSPFFKLLFLFSSFGPLYLVFSIKTYYVSGVPALLWFVFLCAFFVSVIVFVGTARKMRQGVKRTYKVVDVKTKDAEIFPYIMAYIPPRLFFGISASLISIFPSPCCME